MSIDVSIEELATAIGERGTDAYLVTVRGSRPHVVAVSVAVRPEGLVVAAGRRTPQNIETHPEVTLLWPVTDAHPNHSLLVDGTASCSDDGQWLTIVATSAVLHRAGGRRRRLPDEG